MKPVLSPPKGRSLCWSGDSAVEASRRCSTSRSRLLWINVWTYAVQWRVREPERNTSSYQLRLWCFSNPETRMKSLTASTIESYCHAMETGS